VTRSELVCTVVCQLSAESHWLRVDIGNQHEYTVDHIYMALLTSLMMVLHAAAAAADDDEVKMLLM